MPCWTVQRAQLDIGKVNPDVLAETMKRLGIDKDDFRLARNVLTLSGAASSFNVEKIKQEISKTIVLSQAKRFGFHVKEDQNGKLLLTKKAF